jgi:RNA polymerase sigma factor (sigma-70 family)
MDMQTIQKAQRGDTSAINAIVKDVQKRASCMARKFKLSEHMQDEVAQEACMAVMERLTTFNPAKSTFGTWSYMIMHGRCLIYKRQEDLQRGYAKKAFLLDRKDPMPTPEEIFMQKQNEEQKTALVRNTLCDLDAPMQDTYRLAIIQEMGFREVGKALGVSHQMVSQRLAKIEQKMMSRVA